MLNSRMEKCSSSAAITAPSEAEVELEEGELDWLEVEEDVSTSVETAVLASMTADCCD